MFNTYEYDVIFSTLLLVIVLLLFRSWKS